MIGITYTGCAYTNVAAGAGTTYYPSGEIGSTTATAGDSFTVGAKRVVIYAIVVRTFTASTTEFQLQSHDGLSVITAITPDRAGTINFGPVGLEVPYGWRLVQGATTASTLMVVWKKLA